MEIFHYNHNSEGRGGSGGTEIILQGKAASVLQDTPKDNNLAEMLDDNHERGSVAKNSPPSENNNTTLTPSVITTREIVSNF